MTHPSSVHQHCDYTEMVTSSAAIVRCEGSEQEERKNGGKMTVTKEEVSFICPKSSGVFSRPLTLSPWLHPNQCLPASLGFPPHTLDLVGPWLDQQVWGEGLHFHAIILALSLS